MKKVLFRISTLTLLIVAACNNNDTSSKKSDTSKMNMDSSNNVVDTGSMVAVTHTFNDVDAKLVSSLKFIVDHYLQIKNALVNDDADKAADAGNAMYEGMGKIDKSLFTPDQKKVYDGIEDDLKEHAEHISKSKLDHQREHFAMMSEDVYDLVKAFGGGQILYHDHCPMANDNKGAMWLSEMKEVKNPYFGGKMNECVKVKEVIK